MRVSILPSPKLTQSCFFPLVPPPLSSQLEALGDEPLPQRPTASQVLRFTVNPKCDGITNRAVHLSPSNITEAPVLNLYHKFAKSNFIFPWI